MFPREHPISDAIRADVLRELERIELDYDVRVLYACESGSRAWGFASPDSDYDVRFIYVHRRDWYLSVLPGRDVIEVPISSELDVSGWDLRKALTLLGKSNPVFYEWLSSPVVYRQDRRAMERLRQLAADWFMPERCRWHYLSMAKRNYREHLSGEEVRFKRYLYVLRPLLAARWVDEGRGVPPMAFAELAEALLPGEELRATVAELLRRKMLAGEAATTAPWPLLQQYIAASLAELEQPTPRPSTPTPQWATLNRYLSDVVLDSSQW